MDECPDCQAHMDECPHGISRRNEENCQEHINTLLFKESMNYVDLALSFLNPLISLSERDHGGDEEKRPTVRHVHWVQHQVEQVHVLLSFCDNTRLSRWWLVTDNPKGIEILAVFLELFHLLLIFGFHNFLKIFVNIFAIKFPLHSLPFVIRDVCPAMDLFVNLPLLVPCFPISIFAWLFISPVKVDEIEEFRYFWLAIFFLFECKWAEKHFFF